MKFSTLFSALLFSQGVLSCVYFQAELGSTANAPFQSTLVDNGQTICWYDGVCNGCTEWPYTCIAANYAAIVYNAPGGSLRVTYANPHGNFEFIAPINTQYTSPNVIVWQAYEYGC